LERILIQLDSSLAEVGLDDALVNQLTTSSSTIGEFLAEVGTIIAKRTTELREIKSLPSVLFIVSSGPEVVGEANRLRRAGSFVLKAEELIAYSPRSEAGKWWQERQKQPEQNLSYIISLFGSQLATLSASAVAYSCLHNGAANLIAIANAAGMQSNKTNAETTLKATDLYRMLMGEKINELTSSQKGKIKDTTLKAYEGLQAQSAQQHLTINEGIVKALAGVINEIDLAQTNFEVDAGDQNLRTDCVLQIGAKQRHLEFHHLSEAVVKRQA
jgi:hypothetical protein